MQNQLRVGGVRPNLTPGASQFGGEVRTGSIIEAVVEDIEVKRALLKKVEAVRRPGTIVTTNTSGLPVTKIAEGFGGDFRRNWFAR